MSSILKDNMTFTVNVDDVELLKTLDDLTSLSLSSKDIECIKGYSREECTHIFKALYSLSQRVDFDIASGKINEEGYNLRDKIEKAIARGLTQAHKAIRNVYVVVALDKMFRIVEPKELTQHLENIKDITKNAIIITDNETRNKKWFCFDNVVIYNRENPLAFLRALKEREIFIIGTRELYKAFYEFVTHFYISFLEEYVETTEHFAYLDLSNLNVEDCVKVEDDTKTYNISYMTLKKGRKLKWRDI